MQQAAKESYKAKEMNKHKKSDKMKWIATALAGVILAGACATTLAMGIKNNGWFQKDDDPKIDQPDDTIPDNNETSADEVGANMLLTPNKSNAAIKITSVRLSEVLDEPALMTYAADNGISAQAASNVQRLTATVTPADAANKALDWSVAWLNASDTWAAGKTVTDYVTVTPTADGALTADVACNQAFAAKIQIKAVLRDASDLFDTCTVDYVQKITGVNFRMQYAEGSNTMDWSLTPANLNPSVDFYKGTLSAQVLGLGLCHASNTTLTVSEVKSSVYTKAASYYGTQYSIAPTAAYLTALENAGFTTTATAETYTAMTVVGTDITTVGQILFTNYISGANSATTTNFANFKSNLRTNASSVMLRIKAVTTLADQSTVEFIYNIKFASASFVSTATSVGGLTDIEF